MGGGGAFGERGFIKGGYTTVLPNYFIIHALKSEVDIGGIVDHHCRGMIS